jgi:hypothetical protein
LLNPAKFLATFVFDTLGFLHLSHQFGFCLSFNRGVELENQWLPVSSGFSPTQIESSMFNLIVYILPDFARFFYIIGEGNNTDSFFGDSRRIV